LLWFFPGYDDEQLPAYKDQSVKNALGSNHLVFLSGAGCASQLVMVFAFLVLFCVTQMMKKMKTAEVNM